MRKLLLCALLSAARLQAQDISGDWQGTLGEGTDKIRLVLRIAKGQNSQNPWTGTFFSIDQNPDWGAGTLVKSITLQHPAIKFMLEGASGAVEGAVNPDGASIT